MNEEDELNQDFDKAQDSDFDTDFGEFDQEKEKGSFGDLVKKNPAIKIGLIVAALVVVIGAIMLFGGSSKKKLDSSVAQGRDVKDIPGTKELSPEMKDVITQVNDQNVENALKSGGSAIPQPIETSKTSLTVPSDDAQTEDPLLRWRQMQADRLKAQQEEQAQQQQQKADPAEAQALQSLISAMTAQMTQILSGKKIENLKSMKITSLQEILEAKQAQQQQQQGNTAAQQAARTAAAQQAGLNVDPTTGAILPAPKILLPAGAIEYGQLLLEANSDVQGPIAALIVSGPFQGSRLLGSFQTQEEYLVLQFNTLVNKKGLSIPVNAYALDPDTTLTGMATDVDHRYWERIILPAAADFIQGIGQAYADKEGQQTVVTGDVVVQSDPPLNYKEQIGSGVSKAASKVSQILTDQGSQTKPLVRVAAGTPMGILFMTAITDQDELASKNNPVTARTLQAQQQQTLLQQQQTGTQQGNNPFYLIQGLQNSQGLQSGTTGTSGTTTTTPTSTSTTTGTGYSTIPSNSYRPSNIYSTGSTRE